jgi:hypothetical protein
VVFVPNSGAGSNITSACASNTIGSPVEIRERFLQAMNWQFPLSEAEGMREHYQASQRCSRRQRIRVYESAHSSVTETVTDKNALNSKLELNVSVQLSILSKLPATNLTSGGNPYNREIIWP